MISVPFLQFLIFTIFKYMAIILNLFITVHITFSLHSFKCLKRKWLVYINVSFFPPGKSELEIKVLMKALCLLLTCANWLPNHFHFVRKDKINRKPNKTLNSLRELCWMISPRQNSQTFHYIMLLWFDKHRILLNLIFDLFFEPSCTLTCIKAIVTWVQYFKQQVGKKWKNYGNVTDVMEKGWD